LRRIATGNILAMGKSVMTRKQTVALCVVGFLILAVPGGLFAWNRYNPPTPVQVADKLCDYVVHEQKMKCVTVLAADTYMKPGSIVEYNDNPDGSSGRVPLPTADLLGEACQVPGAPALKSGVSARASISIPQMAYETNTGLKEGADIDVPKFKELQFKAGPKWSEVSKVELANNDAWAINLDELVAAQAYQSCQIRKSCTEYLAARRYSVVQTTIVADGLSYKVYNRSGELVLLDAGMKSGQFSASVGGSTDIQSSTDATIKASEPRVVGVRLLPSEVFEQKQSCDKDVVFDAPTGTSLVRLAGSGGDGNIGSPTSRDAPIGKSVGLELTGTEPCNESRACARSSAFAEAKVTDVGPGKLEFAYELRAEKGYFIRRLPTDILEQRPVETSAFAIAEFQGSMPVTVRAEDVAGLTVSCMNMPPDTKIELFDWKNQRLKLTLGHARNANARFDQEGFLVSVEGDWKGNFKIEGPGVYRLSVSLSSSASSTALEPDKSWGNRRQGVPSITVAVAPTGLEPHP
jgi:hypothetical protein